MPSSAIVHVVRRWELHVSSFACLLADFLSIWMKLLRVASLRLSECYSVQPQTWIPDHFATMIADGEASGSAWSTCLRGVVQRTDEVKPSLV
jgi:hypothetical protein